MSDQLPPLDDELAGLLGDARGELAPAAAKAKARAALGLPPPSSAAPHSPEAPPRPPSAPAGAAPAAASAGTVGTIIKGTIVAVLIGGAFTVGLRVGEDRAREEFEKLPPKTVTIEVPVPTPVPTPPVEVAPPTPVPTPVVTPVVTPKPSPVAGDTLEAELALLEPVRAALEKKDAGAALEAVGKYDAKFARGSMRTEAGLMRLEALLLAGKRNDAEALAKKLSSTTDSELVRTRIKRLLDAP